MKILGTIIILVLIIFITTAIVGPISHLSLASINGTTTQQSQNISEAPIGGTIKQLPGLMPILQLYPLLFIFIGFLFVAKIVGDFGGDGFGSGPYHASTGISLEEPEEEDEEDEEKHYYPPWNCANCAGPNPENHPMCQYCGEAYAPRAVKYS